LICKKGYSGVVEGKMNKEGNKRMLFPWLHMLFIIAVISVVTLIILLQIPSSEDEQYLQDKIDNMNDVSDQYRMGWKDCIKALHNWKRRATNATASAAVWITLPIQNNNWILFTYKGTDIVQQHLISLVWGVK